MTITYADINSQANKSQIKMNKNTKEKLLINNIHKKKSLQNIKFNKLERKIINIVFFVQVSNEYHYANSRILN